MSLLDGEKLSPIKLAAEIIDHSNHLEMQRGLSPSSLLGKHPHGLTAKHEAKSGHQLHSLTNTPVTARSEFGSMSAVKRAPLTSPRRNLNPSLDSLRKMKASLDSRLSKLRSDNSPGNKENLNSSFSKYLVSSPQFHPSSPTRKRSLPDDNTPNKISKVVTSANDDHSVPVDDVFNKEDLVGQISASNSPNRSRVAQIHDDDSDSDVDEYPAESQTNYKIKQTLEDNTQQSRILKISDTGDYITPQRLTEPVAKSPQTHQHTRVAPVVSEKPSMTSPTKQPASDAIVDEDADDDDLKPSNDEEPTINFLMSPNSKPVFSLDHIKKIKNDHYSELKALETVVTNKNQEILKFSQELSATNSKFLEYDQIIKDLKSARKKLLDNEELLQVQLKHNEREIASAHKKLKIKTNQLTLAEERAKVTEEQLTELNKNYEDTSKLFESLQHELDEHQLKFKEFSIIKQDLEGEIEALNHKVTGLTSQLEATKSENKKLGAQLEDLNREAEGLREVVADQQDYLNKVQEEREKNQKTKEKEDLEKAIEINILKEDKEKLQSQLDHIQSLRQDDEVVRSENEKLVLKLKEAEAQLKESDESSSSMKNRLQKLQSDYEESQALIVECNKTIDALKSSNNEKDEIIRGDTKGMSELTEKINQLKQTILETEKKSQEKTDDGDVDLLKRQLEDYKRQNEENRARTNAKIHKVAEQLYKEYSKKHELKVSQLKNTFQKQLDGLKIEKNSHRRDVESLQKKLELVNMEKEQLLKLTRGKPFLQAKPTRKPRN